MNEIMVITCNVILYWAEGMVLGLDTDRDRDLGLGLINGIPYT